MSFTRLSDLLDVQLLTCLLMEKMQREKYSRTIKGLNSKVIYINRSIHKGGTLVKLLREKWGTVKALTQEITTKALALFEEVGYLEKSLKRAHNTLNSLKERVSLLNDEVVATSVYHFERDIKHASFLYPDLD